MSTQPQFIPTTVGQSGIFIMIPTGKLEPTPQKGKNSLSYFSESNRTPEGNDVTHIKVNAIGEKPLPPMFTSTFSDDPNQTPRRYTTFGMTPGSGDASGSFSSLPAFIYPSTEFGGDRNVTVCEFWQYSCYFGWRFIRYEVLHDHTVKRNSNGWSISYNGTIVTRYASYTTQYRWLSSPRYYSNPDPSFAYATLVQGNWTEDTTYGLCNAARTKPSVAVQGFYALGEQYLGYNTTNFKYRWYEPMGKSFLNAVEGLPSLASTNNIANLRDIASLLRGLLKGDFTSLLNSPLSKLHDSKWQSEWLKYRYQYCTSKSDIKDIQTFIRRTRKLNEVHTVHGMHVDSTTGAVWRCTVTCADQRVSMFKDIARRLDSVGLFPTPYVLWDLVPLSFVIDWILPAANDVISVVNSLANVNVDTRVRSIGGLIDELSAYEKYTDTNLKVMECWYSVKYTNSSKLLLPGYTFSVYNRFRSDSVPDLSGYYWSDDSSTSDATLVKRIIDGVAMITQKK